nr:MAG TPA: DNA polymerase II small subunit [Caudoviricetes sp.]
MSIGRDRDEGLTEYKIRICSEREQLGLTWDEVAQVLNEEYGDNYGESKYRKWWYAFQEGMNYVNTLEAEKEEAVKEYIGEQKKDFQILKNGEQASSVLCKLSDEQLKDPDYILKVHGYDSNEWELTSAKQSIWNSKIDNELYSSKITVKPRKGFNWSEDNIKKIFEKLEKHTEFSTSQYAKIASKDAITPDKNKMLLIGVADLHYGLLAKENLSEEYNMKIAEQRFDNIIDDVICRKQSDNTIEKVILLIGNDFLSADNVQGTTSRHFTQQDQETNWYEIIESATEMLVKEIDKLKYYFPKVIVMNVKGNHDEMSTFGIMQTLNAYYKNNEQIEINTSCKFRQYIRYGTNLIGLSHNERIQDVSKIMAAETGTYFGECRYKLFLMGHLHKQQLLEDDYGVDIRRMPSVVGASAWTAQQGYTGTNKMSQTFVFDKDKGLIEVMNTIVE